MIPTIIDGRQRHDAGVEQELTGIETRAMVEAHRVRSLEYVASTGMVAISHISALETALVRSTPGAASRLRAVGDVATHAVLNEIASLLR